METWLSLQVYATKYYDARIYSSLRSRRIAF